MAVALESQNLSWQRIRIFLDSLQSTPFAIGANSGFKAFKSWMTQFKLSAPSNASTQVLFFDDAQLTTAGGLVSLSGACHVYAAFIKKVGTMTTYANGTSTGTATASYFKIYDDATDDTTAAHTRFILGSLAAGDEQFLFYPQGVAFTTGVVVASDTTATGSTDSTAGDSGSGFVLIGG